MPQTLDEGFATATAVFMATVVSNDTPTVVLGGASRPGHAKLRVDKVWKSDRRKIDVILSGGSCDYYLEPRKTYIIFAGRYTSTSFWSFLPFVYGELYVDSCSLTTGTHFWDDCDLYPGPCQEHKRRMKELIGLLDRKIRDET